MNILNPVSDYETVALENATSILKRWILNSQFAEDITPQSNLAFKRV
jgi:hypothetical protein